ncbi:MAG TPA: glycosyltransferase [Chitinophagaceae bacterium]|nr:glycosyltransferase [Chitinophagaceae bacterium]
MSSKIEIVILSDPDYYPPTIHAANILAERGHKVTLIGIKYPVAQKQQLNSSIKRIDYGSHRKGLMNVLQYFSFYIWYFFHLLRNRPDWIIAYDAMSVGPVAMNAKLLNVKFLFHSHDLLQNPTGWYKLIGWIEKKFAKKANVVSFPQEDRAVDFSAKAKLSSDPIIVYNGPRMSWSEKNYLPHPQIADWKKNRKFIVLYQGQFSKYFNLDKLIASFEKVNPAAVLVMIGRELEPGIIDNYQKIISEKTLSDRIKILQSLPYDEVPSVTKFANLGVAKLVMNKDTPANDYFLTGASNKVSEYLSFGLPVLMADTSVNREFYSKHNCAIFADGESASSIANAINSIIDAQAYEPIQKGAAAAGKTVFNYDTQFQKVVDIIEA